MRAIWGILIFAVYFVLANLIFGYISPSMIFVGFPCPACGLTRAGFLFLTGNFAASFEMHPLFLPVIIFLAVYVLVKFRWPDKMKVLHIPAAVLIVASFALYIFRMFYLFPHQPPLVMNENAILFNIISIIRELI
ncbi:MAG: DUF2752 domain-containing protein [Defluviitaleaceae bacterium]|nr:DUF2752 domain-containing protein [Defluviitaleaceae bacterium]